MCDDNIFELERIDHNGLKFNHWAVYKFRLLKHYSKFIFISVDFDHKLWNFSYGWCSQSSIKKKMHTQFMSCWAYRSMAHETDYNFDCFLHDIDIPPSPWSHQTCLSQIGKKLIQIYPSSLSIHHSLFINEFIIHYLSKKLVLFPWFIQEVSAIWFPWFIKHRILPFRKIKYTALSLWGVVSSLCYQRFNFANDRIVVAAIFFHLINSQSVTIHFTSARLIQYKSTRI
mgnify:CR=1 FL=1